MTNYSSMRRITMPVVAVLLLVTATATAQRNKRNRDNTAVFQEFARLGKWNTQWPVEINLHITHYVTPTVLASDSADTDMTLYYDPHAFYMQAEGMEQLANDSVLVLVNKAAQIIKVFPNKGLQFYSQGNNLASFMPDTSMEKLAQRFLATMEEEGHSGKRIILQSRDRISGTELEREMIDVHYNADNYQPLQYKQVKRSMVPVDSATYVALGRDAAWKGRLVTTNVKAGQLFFVVKEQVTACHFTSINHAQKMAPVQVQDRVVKTAGDEYQPAKGYETYNVSLD
ncbi:hypothetical protein A4H97_08860 [Niastella yeongjuensis]|uniref:Uncharacterized protein n=1 Tax=Niastella yeongjuensis TaxID=354355 RepID=A0A1V9EED3_9BACT|nr:hypothetical protein [Niastella yeongjuensis]OQP44476.1 hypothetical protein A4H97_08860 [Niastella yeongjuensis]SEO86315.1 hypothetical protein SAMN05660816_03774 [Niastella yeongjuensis]